MGCSNQDISRTNALESELKALQHRDLELWGMAFLVMVLLVVGIISLVLPNTPTQIRIEVRYLPQLTFGLLALVLLLNLYLAAQRRALYRTTNALSREIAYIERLQQFSFIDPLTQTFNRRYLDSLFQSEAKRSNRSGQPITLLLVTRSAPASGLAADEAEIEVAQVLRSNFRGSDCILRYAQGQFLVVMPDTTQEQAAVAVKRLLDNIDSWNLNSDSSYEMSLAHARITCLPGGDLREHLRRIEADIQGRRNPVTQLECEPAPRCVSAS